MRLVICLTFAIGVILSGVVATPLLGDQTPSTSKADSAPTLRASDILSRETLQGRNYEVGEFAPVQERKCLFTIKCDNLEFTVLGQNLLIWRLRELRAWERAQRLHNSKKEAPPPIAQQPIVRPVKFLQHSLKPYASQPRGRALQPQQTAGDLPPEKVVPPDVRAGTIDQRKLALALGCDPETSYPPLHQLLESLSKPEALDDDPLPRKPEKLATFSWLSLPADSREQLITKAPHEVLQLLDQELTELQVTPDTRQKFCFQLDLTTFQKLLFLTNFRSLASGARAEELFSRVILSADEVTAFDRLQELGLARELWQREPGKCLTWRPNGILLTSQTDTHVLVLAGDYLTADADFTAEVTDLRRDFPQNPLSIYTSAKVSPVARKLLERLKITLNER